MWFCFGKDIGSLLESFLCSSPPRHTYKYSLTLTLSLLVTRLPGSFPSRVVSLVSLFEATSSMAKLLCLSVAGSSPAVLDIKGEVKVLSGDWSTPSRIGTCSTLENMGDRQTRGSLSPTRRLGRSLVDFSFSSQSLALFCLREVLSSLSSVWSSQFIGPGLSRVTSPGLSLACRGNESV